MKVIRLLKSEAKEFTRNYLDNTFTKGSQRSQLGLLVYYFMRSCWYLKLIVLKLHLDCMLVLELVSLFSLFKNLTLLMKLSKLIELPFIIVTGLLELLLHFFIFLF